MQSQCTYGGNIINTIGAWLSSQRSVECENVYKFTNVLNSFFSLKEIQSKKWHMCIQCLSIYLKTLKSTRSRKELCSYNNVKWFIVVLNVKFDLFHWKKFNPLRLNGPIWMPRKLILQCGYHCHAHVTL
jgi:hypothetical protein